MDSGSHAVSGTQSHGSLCGQRRVDSFRGLVKDCAHLLVKVSSLSKTWQEEGFVSIEQVPFEQTEEARTLLHSLHTQLQDSGSPHFACQQQHRGEQRFESKELAINHLASAGKSGRHSESMAQGVPDTASHSRSSRATKTKDIGVSVFPKLCHRAVQCIRRPEMNTASGTHSGTTDRDRTQFPSTQPKETDSAGSPGTFELKESIDTIQNAGSASVDLQDARRKRRGKKKKKPHGSVQQDATTAIDRSSCQDSSTQVSELAQDVRPENQLSKSKRRERHLPVNDSAMDDSIGMTHRESLDVSTPEGSCKFHEDAPHGSQQSVIGSHQEHGSQIQHGTAASTASGQAPQASAIAHSAADICKRTMNPHLLRCQARACRLTGDFPIEDDVVLSFVREYFMQSTANLVTASSEVTLEHDVQEACDTLMSCLPSLAALPFGELQCLARICLDCSMTAWRACGAGKGPTPDDVHAIALQTVQLQAEQELSESLKGKESSAMQSMLGESSQLRDHDDSESAGQPLLQGLADQEASKMTEAEHTLMDLFPFVVEDDVRMILRVCENDLQAAAEKLADDLENGLFTSIVEQAEGGSSSSTCSQEDLETIRSNIIANHFMQRRRAQERGIKLSKKALLEEAKRMRAAIPETPMPKVRYRNNQIVTWKGEKFIVEQKFPFRNELPRMWR